MQNNGDFPRNSPLTKTLWLFDGMCVRLFIVIDHPVLQTGSEIGPETKKSGLIRLYTLQSLITIALAKIVLKTLTLKRSQIVRAYSS